MWNRALSIIMIMAIVGVVATIVYAKNQPIVGETYTEFYILGLEAKAIDYPRELAVDKEEDVILGIVNQEYETVSYTVEVRIDGVKNNEVGPIVLNHGGKWEREVGFVPSTTGKDQKVEFLLFRDGHNEVYRAVHLVVNVE